MSFTRPDAAPDGSNRPLPERIAELEAERRTIELRKTSHSLREIAQIMGCSVSTVHRRVHRGFRRLAPIEEAEALRARENDAMNTRERLLYAKLASDEDGTDPLTTSEYLAVNAAIDRIAALRIKLNGLEVPVTQKIEVVSQWEQEIEQLTRELTEQEPT